MTRVAHIRWRPFRLRMRARFEAAHGTLEDREGLLLEVTLDGGGRGIGEASPMASLGHGSLADVVALLEGYGAQLLRGEGVPDGPGKGALRCALDVAVLDARGRAEGKPVAALLSPDPAPWVMANAIIGGGPPTEVARFGHEAQQAGYAVLKLKVGVGSVAEDQRRVAALREACPEAVIRLDANGAWDEATALEALAAFAPYGIELLEQPVAAGEVDALERLRERAPMRIAADESAVDPATLERVIERRAADLLVLKPMLLGGLTPARSVAMRAAERGIGAFVTTTFDSSIGTAASLHLAASLPADAAHGLATSEHLATDVVARTLLPERGRLALPAGDGLGIDVDEAALEAVATGPWRDVEA